MSAPHAYRDGSICRHFALSSRIDSKIVVIDTCTSDQPVSSHSLTLLRPDTASTAATGFATPSRFNAYKEEHVCQRESGRDAATGFSARTGFHSRHRVLSPHRLLSRAPALLTFHRLLSRGWKPLGPRVERSPSQATPGAPRCMPAKLKGPSGQSFARQTTYRRLLGRGPMPQCKGSEI
eukprot:1509605-Amphidinium_carterae.1